MVNVFDTLNVDYENLFIERARDFNCDVFHKVNQTFEVTKEFSKVWEKFKNNAHFCLLTPIYEFLTKFQKQNISTN